MILMSDCDFAALNMVIFTIFSSDHKFVASELSLSECSQPIALDNSFWPEEWLIHGDFYGLAKCS